jgi:hypothetical protein
MKWLEDQVASIREAATTTLQKIAKVRARGGRRTRGSRCALVLGVAAAAAPSPLASPRHPAPAPAQQFGPEWTKEHLVPPVVAMVKNPHYLYRMTVLGAVAALASYVPKDVLRGTLLPVVVQCAKDKVRAGAPACGRGAAALG